MSLKISAIVPTHNRLPLLRRAVKALGRQSLKADEYEVIVVCDGATDGTFQAMTEEATSRTNLRVLQQCRSGPAAARNAGAAAAASPLLAFVDDDCLASEEWLAGLIQAFDDPTVVAVRGLTLTCADQVTPLTHEVETTQESGLWVTCNAACRKAAFNAVRGFESRFAYPHNEDIELAWRLERLGRIAFEGRALVIHPPRKETFARKVASVRYLEAEFLLFKMHPEEYRRRTGPSPWWTIYWEVLVVGHLYQIKTWARYLVYPFKPEYFILGLAVVAGRCASLFRHFPDYWRAAREANRLKT